MKRGDLDEFGQPILWVSWTRLQTYEKCPMQAHLTLQGKTSKIKDGRGFAAGNLADRSVRKFLSQSEPQKAGQLEQYVDALWDELITNSSEYRFFWKADDPLADQERIREKAKTAVRILEPYLFNRVLPNYFQPDWKFAVPIKIPYGESSRTIVLNGAADIVTKTSTGNIFIDDLKCTTNENYTDNFTGQLLMYMVCWHLLFGTEYDKITCAFLTPLCREQYRALEVGVQDRRHLMTRVVEYAHFVWGEQLNPKLTEDSSICYFCNSRAFCPRFASVGEGKTISLSDTAALRKTTKDQNE